MSTYKKLNLIVTCLFVFAGISYACNLTPIADIDSDPNSRCLGEIVSFDASGSYDPDGGTIDAYVWVFPEGAYDISGSHTSTPSCKFSTSGTYDIKLKVLDDDDDWSVEYDTWTVTVVEVQSLLPDLGAEIEDNDPNTRTFVVCTAGSGDVTVTAAPNPTVTEANLPVCWSMTGGTGSGQLSRTVSLTSTGSTTISVTTCGTSNASTIIDVSADTDSDGMPDNWETHFGLNPNSSSDAQTELDSDGLTNLEEYQAGTDPNDNDTDDDGMDDDWEVDNYLDPLNASDNDLDLDSDGYTNLGEYLHVSDPNDVGSIPTSNITIDVPADVSVIQSAINASINGDTIEVAQGTYYEAIDLLGKSITVEGSDPDDWSVVDATVIDADDMGPVVTFAGTEDPNCHVTGLTLTGGLAGKRDGLVAYWDMNEGTGITAFDGSGDSNDGTLTGGPVWDPNGYIGGALDFDGTDDYVLISGYKGVTGTQSRTIAAWIKTTVGGDIITWGDAVLEGKWRFKTDTTSGALYVQVHGGFILAETDVCDGQWHHVAAVYNANYVPNCSEVKIYVDGSEDVSSSITAYAVNTDDTVDVRIGAYLYSPNYFDGLIDEVRIYDRELNTNEIAELATKGLVAYWRLDEISGTTAYDSFDSKDGTLTDFSGTDSEWQRGVLGGALDFDGSDDYVEITGYKGVTGNQPRTCSAWVKTSVGGDVLCWGNNQSVGDKWRIRISGTNNVLCAQVGGFCNGSTPLDDNQWHHIAVVFRGAVEGLSGTASEILLYVDGKLDVHSSVSEATINTIASGDVQIGLYSWNGSGTDFFDGLIDDVRIYQVALSPDEVKQVYQTGGGIMGNGATAQISKCVITENFSVNDGGGISFVDGMISRCMITKNISENSGGGLSNCDATIINCVIAGNSSISGGGLANCNNIIENCTIANNLAYQGGGLFDCSASSILNTIIWANWADQDEQMYNSPDPDYSCIQDWTVGGTGNITDDPLFIDPNNFDYHLDPNSTCIDAGDPSLDYSNEPVINGTRINIGAYGNTSEAATTIDSDNDGLSNPDEIRYGTDIFDSDSDDDGMPDGWEVVFGLDPLDDIDAQLDGDGDGLDNAGEYTAGTSPSDKDSDDDSMSDGWEVTYGLEPTDPNDADYDKDADGHSNITEFIHSSDPDDPNILSEPMIIVVPTDVVTIQDAIDWSIDGDTIEILPGTYSEYVYFHGKAITVRSTDPTNWDTVESTIIDPNGLAYGLLFDDNEDANSILDGVTVRADQTAIWCYGAAPTIRRCIIDDSPTGIYSSSSAWPVISDCIVRNCSSIGINVSASSSATVQSCLIYDNDIGITTLIPNSLTVVNSTIVDNTTYGIRQVAGSATTVQNCIVWNNSDDLSGCSATYSCIEDGDAGTGNISNDPNFVNPGATNEPDYHLNLDSPCINSGDPNGVYTGLVDIDGDDRVHGLRVDMGADELPVIWYVDNDVNGLQDGTSWTNAFTSISAAVNTALDKDTVLVATGTYYGAINFEGKSITLMGTDPYDWEIVAATVIDPNDESNAVEFISGEGVDSTVKGLTIVGDSSGIYCYGASPTIIRCLVANNTNDGIQCVAGSPTIIECRIMNNGDYGLRLQVSSAIVTNCLITNNGNGGISGGSPVITNCTIVNNEGYGIYASSGIISNCILWGNTSDDLYNCWATYSCVEDGDLGIGNFKYAPYFVDTANGDYHLMSYSPCINAGDPNSVFSIEPSDTIGQINLGAYGNTNAATVASGDDDGDGLPDTWELVFWPDDDPNIHDPNDDLDSDTLDNLTEYQIGTDPNDADTDDDGLSDGWEYDNDFAWHDHDMDDDGMLDGWEYNNGLNAQDSSDAVTDADGDGLSNLQEYNAQTNPNEIDSDNDGMPDEWEYSYGLVPTDPNDANDDSDQDGFSNISEYFHDSEPNNVSSTSGPMTIVVPTDVVRIQDAIDWSISGDIIEILPGTYYENLNFNGKSIKVRSVNPDDWDIVQSTVIDANDVLYAVLFENSEDANSVVEGLTIQNGQYGVWCSSATPTINRCVIRGNSIWGMCSTSSACPEITSCIVRDNDGGVVSVFSSSLTMKSCWIYGNSSYGIRATNQSTLTVLNTTVVDNATAGISQLDGPSAIVQNCIVWNSNDDLDGCSATYSCIEDGDTGTGNISSDPNFVNPTDPNEPDYHLNLDSPCINAGDPNGMYTDLLDIDGEIRLRGKAVDMGADEAPVSWYVDIDADGTENGFSWNDAFTVIQDGIDAATNHDTVIIAEGTYYESIDFNGKAITVQSTDLEDWDVVASTTIDPNDPNGIVVMFSSNEANDSILDGFTINNGGTGIQCINSSPIVTHCNITNNNVHGVKCDSGSPIIRYCQINTNEDYGLKLSGSLAIVENCIVSGNNIGIEGKVAQIRNCTIVSNGDYGIYGVSGLITNSILWDNNDDLYACAVTYSCVEDADSGTGNMSYFPYFADPNAGDFHLVDHSPCIDSGDPSSNYSSETNDGGGRINMGAYGNTSEATLASADSDSDTIPDTWETLYWPSDDPNVHDPNDDLDNDSLSNLTEYQAGSDPTDDDTDDDGLDDGWENSYGLQILEDDSATDVDGDGLNNLAEYANNTDPTDSDSDDDHMPDGWEVDNGLDPTQDDASSDMDSDNYSNVVEYLHGGDPNDNASVLSNVTIRVPSDAATIQQGIDWSIDWDVVLVYPGLYSESIDLKGRTITVTGSNPNDWGVIASTVISAGAGETETVLFNSGEDPNTILTGFMVTNDGTDSTDNYGIRCDAASSPTISRCIVEDNLLDGIYVSSGSPVIDSSMIGLNTDDGIRLTTSDAPRIQNSWIYGNGDEGIDIEFAGSASIIRNNTIVSNVGNGLYYSSDPNNMPMVTNCIVWESGANDLDGCVATYSCIEDGDSGAGNISTDPQFFDVVNHDYRLERTSPCVDSGDPNNVYLNETDIFNQVREAGTVDIGADEVCVIHNTSQGKWYLEKVQDAIDAANADDVIKLYEWTFTENIDFDGKSIMLTSTDPYNWNVVENTVIECADPNLAVVSFTSGEDPNSILSGITVHNGDSGIYCSNNSSPMITRCVIDYNVDGVYSVSGAPIVKGNRITGSGGGGVVSESPEPPTVIGNLVYGNCTGVQINDANSIAAVINNTVVNNSIAGIKVDSGIAPDVTNCIIWDNNNNNLINTTATYSCVDTSGTGNIDSEPGFEDYISGDLHLADDSPLIGAGDSSAMAILDGQDIDGQPWTKALQGAMGADLPSVSVQPIYVDGNISVTVEPDVEGTTWELAFKDLKAAIEKAVGGDVIYVASTLPENPYMPGSGVGESFELKGNVKIYGGFPEGGGDWEERDPEIHQTVLSGDHGDKITDADPFTNLYDNSYHVVTAEDVDHTAILDGFVITGGDATRTRSFQGSMFWAQRTGGGLFNQYASPTIRNCKFRYNCSWKGGGAIGNYYAAPNIENCYFTKSLNTRSGSSNINNMYCSDTVTISGCVFEKNGWLVSEHNIIQNWATEGCIGNGYGSVCEVENSFFIENKGHRGSSINNSGYIQVQNCVFVKNQSAYGGAIYNDAESHIFNCTIVGNTAYYGGGVYNDGDGNNAVTEVTNCIIWGNTDNYSGNDQVKSSYSANPVQVSHCDIQGSFPDLWDSEIGTDLGGNIDSDPKFLGGLDFATMIIEGQEDEVLGTLDDPLCLEPDSPCAGTGLGGSDRGAYPSFKSYRVAISSNRNYVRITPDTGIYGDNITFHIVEGSGQSYGTASVHDGTITYTRTDFSQPSASDTFQFYVSDGTKDTSDSPSTVTVEVHSQPLSVPGDYRSINEAIENAIDGDQIVVGKGTYYENLKFNGKDIVLMSSDPDDPEIVAATMIRGDGSDSAVSFMGTESKEFELVGFTISGGYSNGNGGGIFGNGTQATISKCVITDNYAEGSGGGIFGVNGTIASCEVVNNYANIAGGGLADCDGTDTIVNCLIAGNKTDGEGGALYGCDGKILNCTIVDNIAPAGNGVLSNCSGTLKNCIVWKNEGGDFSNSPALNFVESTNWYETDPKFVKDGKWDDHGTLSDPSDDYWSPGDYRLQETSDCVDGGQTDDTHILYKSLDNYLRVMGERVDIGAYEFALAGSIISWGRVKYMQYAPTSDDIIAVSLGRWHGIALRADGTLAGWDKNGLTVVPEGDDFKAIAAGNYFSLALKVDGTVVGWGSNDYGQCNPPVLEPDNGVVYEAIAAKYWYGLALRSDGSLAAWGDDYYGQVSNAPAGNNFIAIAAGQNHALALNERGLIYGWGDGSYGQTDFWSQNEDIVSIYAGDNFSIALRNSEHDAIDSDRDNEFICWGNGDWLAVEGGTPDFSYSNNDNPSLKNVSIISLAGGYSNSKGVGEVIAQTGTNRIMAWQWDKDDSYSWFFMNTVEYTDKVLVKDIGAIREISAGNRFNAARITLDSEATIEVNDDDDDNDGIPDYFDGFNYDGVANEDDLTATENFGCSFDLELPVTEFPTLDGVSIAIIYDGSDSLGLEWNPADRPDYSACVPAPGKIRIWTENHTAVSGDYVRSGFYTPARFGLTNDPSERTKTLYVEGIRPSERPGDALILIKVKMPGTNNNGDAIEDYDRILKAISVTVEPSGTEYESVAGVTPSSGRSLPVVGMDVYAETLMHNSQLKVTHTNFVVPGKKLSAAVSQTYRSGHLGSPYLGKGWFANWDQHFVRLDDRYIYHGPDGRVDEFALNEGDSSKLDIPSGYSCTASFAGDGSLNIIYTDGSNATFQADAGSEILRLRTFKDRWGNKIEYQWEYSGSELDKITISDDMGRPYVIEISQMGGYARVEKVTDFDGLEYGYGYVNGKLQSITLTDFADSNKILSIVNYNYATTGGKYLEKITIGGESGMDSERFLEVSYDATELEEVASMTWGGKVNAVDPDIRVTEYFSTRNGVPNVVEHTDTNGVLRLYSFETAPGRTMLCRYVSEDPYGLNLRTNYNYGRTEPRPTKVIDAMGAQSLHERELVLEEPSTDQRGFGAPTKVGQSSGYHPDPSGNVSANDHRSDYLEYSYASPEDQYYQPDAATHMPSGVQTKYFYDNSEVKNLIEVQLPSPEQKTPTVNPNIIKFKYNSFGQVIAVLASDGGLTVYEYLDSDHWTTGSTGITGYLYRVAKSMEGDYSSTFDDLADLIDINNVFDDDLVDYYFQRDAYGRVVIAQNAKGGNTNYDYDRAGRLKEVKMSEPRYLGGESSRERSAYQYHPTRDFVSKITHYNPVAAGTPLDHTYSSDVSAVTDYGYDGLGRVITITKPVQDDDGITQIYYESAKERLDYIERVDGGYDHIDSYDAAGRPELLIYNHNSTNTGSIIEPAYAVRYQYDENSDVIEEYFTHGTTGGVTPGGATEYLMTSISRDWMGRPSLVYSEISEAKVYTGWDESGRLNRRMVYDGDYQFVSDVSYSYYNNGDFKRTTDNITGAMSTIEMDYEAATSSVESTLTSTLSHKHENEFNSLGWPVKGKYYSDATNVSRYFKREFDANGNLNKAASDASDSDVTDNLGSAPTATYGLIDHLKKLEVFEGIDATTNVVSSGTSIFGIIEDPLSNISNNEVDEQGMLTKSTEDKDDVTDERVTEVKRDRNDRIVLNFRSGQATKTYFDLAGNVTKVEYFYGATNKDTLGDVDATEEFTYDEKGRIDELTRKNDSDSIIHELSFTYYSSTTTKENNRDQLHEIKDASSNLLRHLDNYNRFGYPEALQEYYHPGDDGDYVRTDRTYHTSTSTNPQFFGRLVSEETEIYESGSAVANSSYTVGYEYDLGGRRTKLTYPGSAPVLTYDYEDGFFLDKITKDSSLVVYDCTRDSDFRIPTIKELYGSAVDVSINYKSKHLGLVSDMKVGAGTDYYATFSYDKRLMKNKTGQWQSTDTGYFRDYTYDGLGRLKSADGTGDKFGDETFAIDKFENRSSVVYDDNKEIDYTPDSTYDNRYASLTYGNSSDVQDIHALSGSATLPASGTSFTFDYDNSGDDRGNLEEDEHFVYEWDDFNRIIKVTDKTYSDPSSTPQYVEYLYDALGRRIRMKYSGQSSGWDDVMLVYDGYMIIEERNLEDSGSLMWRYYYEDGINKLAMVEDSSSTYVPLIDDRGTLMGVANTSGTVIEKLYYNATGLCRTYNGSNVEKTRTSGQNIGKSEYIPFGWLGMYHDPFTGKYHTHYREYDPVHERWLSEDPAGYTNGLNLYAAYMGVNGVDSLGLDVFGRNLRRRHDSITDSFKGFRKEQDEYLSSTEPEAFVLSFDEYRVFKSGGQAALEKYQKKMAYSFWKQASTPKQQLSNTDKLIFDKSQPWWQKHSKLHKLQHVSLDLVGIFDPSPLADTANSMFYLDHNEYKDAAISGAAAAAGLTVYFIGDLVKVGRFSKLGDDTFGAIKFAGKSADDIPGIGKAAAKSGLRSSPESYYKYSELRTLIKNTGLSGKAKGLEAHHLLEKRFALRLGVIEDDIISVPLTPMWHRNVRGMGKNIDASITAQLQNMGTTPSKASLNQIWNSHKNVYNKLGQNDWANAIFEAYFKGQGVKY